MKNDIFKTELNRISDDNIKESCSIILNLLPDYFYIIPASSTGKYHPSFSLGEGGLVRHVKVASLIAEELFNDTALSNFDDHEKDLIRMAILLHDGFKKGKEENKYTLVEHPLIMANFIKENAGILPMDSHDLDNVARMISKHMGPWTKNRDGEDILEIPTAKDELFVHLCDYFASRKLLNVEFINNEIYNNNEPIKKRK